MPLIGEQGWAEDGRQAASNHLPGHSRRQTLFEIIAAAAEPPPDFADPEFGKLFDRFGDRRVVLSGEASHGTSEFYQAHAAVTRRLIEAHGFNFVAVEADWPEPQRLTTMRGTGPPRAKPGPRFSAFRRGCGAIRMSLRSSSGCAATTKSGTQRGAQPSMA